MIFYPLIFFLNFTNIFTIWHEISLKTYKCQQTPTDWFIHSFRDPFPPNLQNTITPKPLELETWHNVHHQPCLKCHMSCVRLQMSCFKCQLPCVMCPVSCVTFFFLTKWWSYLVEGLLSKGPTQSSILYETLSRNEQFTFKNIFFNNRQGKLQHDRWFLTCDTQGVVNNVSNFCMTHDMWHTTHDTLVLVSNICFGFMMFWRFGGKRSVDKLMN